MSKQNEHGGKRKGAGRPKGSKNKVSIKRTNADKNSIKIRRT